MAFLDSIAQEVNLMNIDKQPSTYETGEIPRSFCCPTGEKGMVDYAFNTLKVTKIICDIRAIK